MASIWGCEALFPTGAARKLTGIGGGVTRDLLVVQIPAVLKGDLYAVAALAAAAVLAIGNRFGWPVVETAAGAGLLCFGVRVLAIWRGWGLPVAAVRSDGGQEAGLPEGPLALGDSATLPGADGQPQT